MIKASRILRASAEIECLGCHKVFPAEQHENGKCPDCGQIWSNFPETQGFEPVQKLVC